jgi:HSP20 family protein
MTYRVSLLSHPAAPSLRGLRRDMDRALDSLLATRVPANGDAASEAIAADILEDEAGWTLILDLPGVAAESLEVLAEERVLTIRGERPSRTSVEGTRVLATERRTGRFERHVRLPATADAEQLTAELALGVLTLRIGKLRPAQPRRVPIQTGVRSEPASAPAPNEAPTPESLSG